MMNSCLRPDDPWNTHTRKQFFFNLLK